MYIRTKITLLLFCIGFLFTLEVSAYFMHSRQEFSALFRNEAEEEKRSFNKLLAGKSESLNAFSYDYSYWDDMVNFIKTKDEAWARQNILPALSTFKADMVWVYGQDFSLVYATDTSSNARLPLEDEALPKIFSGTKHFCHFFINTKSGLLEVNGASVHPTADVKRESPAQGYFFAGRLWNKEFIRELQEFSGVALAVSFPKREEVSIPRLNHKQGIIQFSRVFNGWNGLPLARLDALRESETIKLAWRINTEMFFWHLAFIILLLNAATFFIIRWINKPLGSLQRSLESGDVSYLVGIDKGRDEYAQLSRLILESVRKKEILSKEVAERKKAEEALRSSEGKFRAIFDHANDGILLADEETKKFYTGNTTVCQMLGYSLEEIKKLGVADIHPKEDLPYVFEQVERQTRREIAVAKDLPVKRKDGTVFYADVNTSLVTLTGRTYLLGVFRDITERKQLGDDFKRQSLELDASLKESLKSREILSSMLADNNKIREELESKLEELRQAQSMLVQSEKLASLGQLVSDMAHEVNNPLMIISGNAQLSLLDESLNEELKNNLKIIHEECNRAKSIIQRLLMFSRPSKGERRPVDINRSIESVVKLLEHQFSLSNVKINLQFNTGLPLIAVDDKQFQEVIMNFLNNARDAMPKGGEITVSTSLDGEYFKIEVKDSGVGMDDKTLLRVFEPFFTTKEKGTGLGLSVCYGIIKSHKGKIEFKSQPQKGTTAYIWLPIKVEGV